jgi:hypothetical protein
MQTNPIVGTGYDSFWLGPRLQAIWQSPIGGINEAHDGYLEVYLNLGIVGLFLLSAFLIASYRAICRSLTPFSSLASLTLALWTVLLIYNVTESAFAWQIMWVTFLMGALAVPRMRDNRAQRAPSSETRVPWNDPPSVFQGSTMHAGDRRRSCSTASGVPLRFPPAIRGVDQLGDTARDWASLIT